MKLIISPAKTLDFETPATTEKFTEPQFAPESKKLLADLKKLSPKQIGKLMHISPKLSDLNYDRFQNFRKQPKKQAILAFDGDVYTGLQAGDFSEADLAFAQKHLLILSGLYGLLRPLDLIQAYRLEMGTKLKPPLYDFWGDKLTKVLGDETVINLASIEYSSAVRPKNMINIHFKEMKNGKPVVVALFAKKARGMMARFVIKERVTEVEGLKEFANDGYKFDKKLSDAKNFVFIR